MTPTKIFDTYEQFLTFINAKTTKKVNYGASWSGGSTSTALTKATHGDGELARRAERIVADIDNVLLPSIESYETVSHYYGHRPNISAVITGQPKSMYHRHYVATSDNRGPIRIYLDRACSARFTAQQIVDRGVAVLALVLALKRVRPVTLYVGGTNDYCGHQTVWATALDINNIDLAVLANAVAGTAFYRVLGFSIIETVNPGHTASGIPKGEAVRKLLGWGPNDLIFDGLYLYDADVNLALSNPIGWAKARFATINSAAY